MSAGTWVQKARDRTKLMRHEGSRYAETKALVDRDSLCILGACGVCSSANMCKLGHPGGLESLGSPRMAPLLGTVLGKAMPE